MKVCVAISVAHEGLCGCVSDSCGSMWSRQLFIRDYVAESVIHEDLCGRVSGS